MNFIKSIILFTCSVLYTFSAQAQTEITKRPKVYGVTFSYPWVNNYRFVDYELKNNSQKSGFFGLAIAAYCKQGKNKISLNFGFTEDLSSPIGVIDYSKEGKSKHIGTTFGELLYHNRFCNDLYFIGGFNYTNYIFQYINFTDYLPEYKKTDNTLGLSLGIEYRFNNFFSLATIYKPTIVSFETDGIYRHIISLDFRIDLDILKSKF